MEEGPCLLFLPPAYLPLAATCSLLLRNRLQPLLVPRRSDPCFTLRFVFLDVFLVGKRGHNPPKRWAVHFVMCILTRVVLTWICPCDEILQNYFRLPMQGARIRSRVRELRAYVLQGMTKKTKWSVCCLGFSGSRVLKNRLPMQETQETRVRPLGREDPMQ